MSETDPAPVTPEEPATPDHDTPDEPLVEPEDPANPNREAAKWRTRLREVEAERDQLAERLTAFQRREIEAQLGDILAQPGDLFEVGRAEVSDFYDDDGQLRADELRAAAGALVEQRPGLRMVREFGSAIPRHMNWGQYTQPLPGREASWAEVFGPDRRR